MQQEPAYTGPHAAVRIAWYSTRPPLCTWSPTKPARLLLDHAAILHRLDRWNNRDWSWYGGHIPFFESPDSELDATYC